MTLPAADIIPSGLRPHALFRPGSCAHSLTTRRKLRRERNGPPCPNCGRSTWLDVVRVKVQRGDRWRWVWRVIAHCRTHPPVIHSMPWKRFCRSRVLLESTGERPKLRPCAECGVLMAWPRRKTCSDECFRKRAARFNKESKRRKRESRVVRCADCSVPLVNRRRRRCEDCAAAQERRRMKLREQQRKEQRRARRAGQKCQVCGADISHLRKDAQYCGIPCRFRALRLRRKQRREMLEAALREVLSGPISAERWEELTEMLKGGES